MHLKMVATAAALLTVAACGSQLDPETVAKVNGNAPNGVAASADPGGQTTTDPGTSTGTDPGASTGDPGTGSGDAGGPVANPAGGEHAASGDGPKVSCAGFKNQTGITNDKIVIANASDISGPVPGIFESAQEATRAYVKYFNSTSDICGRKLEVLSLDTRADAGADQQAYTKACDEAFAAVGSMSAFDSGGAAAAQSCGLPDMRSTIVNPERQHCSTCFATQAVSTNLVPQAMASWFVKHYKEATQHVALLYINAGAAPVNVKSQAKGWGHAGWKVDYLQGIDVSEFNFAPYVQQMKDKGIKMVSYTGPYQNTVKLQNAMKQQNFKPEVFVQDQTIYDRQYVAQAGSVGENTFAYSTTDLFENTSNKEMQLYLSWLQQVKPGAIPNYFGLYAWSATRLFVEQALALGGKLDRKSLVGRFNQVKNWTGNGIHAPQQVAAGTTANCQSVFQLRSGTWRRVSPGSYMCAGLFNTGVGG
jgi:ABC-type branched-subunit amino acid transport system substrate-binding protein